MYSFGVALDAGAILLREGVEALLVLTALAAFLDRAGASDKLRALYVGAGLAVLASLFSALAFAMLNNGAHDDRIEMVVLTIAAIMMLYMSGWMFLRQDPRRWTQELKQMATKAMAGPGKTALASVAFLAVFREGAETVLFLGALANTSGGFSVPFAVGLGVACAMIAAIFYAIRKMALHLPLRPVFLTTSAILFVMALRFIGAAIQELQEMQYVDRNEAPIAKWLEWAGFNPSWEALGVQACLALVAIAGVAFAHFRSQSRALNAPAKTNVTAAE